MQVIYIYNIIQIHMAISPHQVTESVLHTCFIYVPLSPMACLVRFLFDQVEPTGAFGRLPVYRHELPEGSRSRPRPNQEAKWDFGCLKSHPLNPAPTDFPPFTQWPRTAALLGSCDRGCRGWERGAGPEAQRGARSRRATAQPAPRRRPLGTRRSGPSGGSETMGAIGDSRE